MSLVTQCPQCALLFQVPAAQVTQLQGRVCCRQCAHVFDGEAFAITAPGLATPAESHLSLPRIDVEALLHRKDVPAERESVPMQAPVPLLHSAPTQQPDSAPAPVAVSTSPLKPDWRIESAAVGAARRTAWMLRSSALLLVLGLCWQSLVFFRDEIAVRWPGGRPMLDALCQPAACTVAPLRRWNGIVIDSSSLVRGDVAYVLNLSLRNSLDIPLAMTALELTLTDDQDLALTRRVLHASDLGAPAVLAAGQVWQRSLSVEPASLQAEIAGYRLVSFYP